MLDRILVVEDEAAIASMTRLCLCKNGYAVDVAYNGKEAADFIEDVKYDLVLLDIMLPDISGYELIDYIKQYDIPVIFVTAKTSVNDRVKGLKLGADDYIIKPFALEELLARIEVVLRRFNKEESVFKVGPISVDILSRIVLCHKKEVSLTAKEFDLLVLLIRNKNIALYRENIYEQVWKEPYLGNTRTVDLHIQRLKKKLGQSGAIETVYTVGYKFVPENLI